MPVSKPKAVIKVPETPQEASDLAKSYMEIRETRGDLEKLEEAQREALLKYIHTHKLEDDPQGITFEAANAGVIGLTYKLEPKAVYVVRNLDNDTILWAAEHNVLTATKTAIDPHKLLPEYEKFRKVLAPAKGTEKLEFVAVQS